MDNFEAAVKFEIWQLSGWLFSISCSVRKRDVSFLTTYILTSNFMLLSFYTAPHNLHLPSWLFFHQILLSHLLFDYNIFICLFRLKAALITKWVAIIVALHRHTHTLLPTAPTHPHTPSLVCCNQFKCVILSLPFSCTDSTLMAISFF